MEEVSALRVAVVVLGVLLGLALWAYTVARQRAAVAEAKVRAGRRAALRDAHDVARASGEPFIAALLRELRPAPERPPVALDEEEWNPRIKGPHR